MKEKINIFENSTFPTASKNNLTDIDQNLTAILPTPQIEKLENIDRNTPSQSENSNPSKKPVRTQRYALNKNKYLLDPEVERLEATLMRSREEHPRDVLMLEIALRTGARAQEVLNLRMADLNAYDRTIFIHGLKGSNDRELPVKEELFQRLYNYAQNRHKNPSATESSKHSQNPYEKLRTMRKRSDGEIFDIGYHRLRQVWDWYRPIPKKFHALRHTFAIRLYRKTKDLRLVQVALGHRNITNTMVYADYIYSQQELRKLIL
jgi:integrase